MELKEIELVRHISARATDMCDLVIFPDGNIFIASSNGQINRLSAHRRTESMLANTGGRPTGIALWDDNHIVVADQERGILSIDVSNHSITTIATTYNGVPLRGCNNVVVAKDKTIYFTVSSSRGDYTNLVHDLAINKPDGKLMQCQADGTVHELMSDLTLPSGLTLTHKQDALLILEANSGNIKKYWISGRKASRTKVECTSLQGIGSSIFADPESDCYWITIMGSLPKSAKIIRSFPQSTRRALCVVLEVKKQLKPEVGTIVRYSEGKEITDGLRFKNQPMFGLSAITRHNNDFFCCAHGNNRLVFFSSGQKTEHDNSWLKNAKKMFGSNTTNT